MLDMRDGCGKTAKEIDMDVHLHSSVAVRSGRTDQNTAAGSLQTGVQADQPGWANPREVAIVRIETRLVASGIH
ncbi:hypothetical protein [Paraburkholderia hospita]|uniref:hypothetical protein n=1 Tax=Paraburkholderia hospita TaxID=169430 RepID=UPI0009A5DEF4|nr:hypothetical protein [Paraburkholderia hospita]